MEIAFVQELLGLNANDVWLLARAHNMASQSEQYKERTVILRSPGESGLEQVVRLYRLLRRFQRGVYFWRSNRNLFMNLAGLGVMFLVAGGKSLVVYHGEIRTLAEFLKFGLEAPRATVPVIEVIAVIMAILFTASRFVYRNIQRNWRRAMFWLQMAFTTVSADKLATFSAECAGRYFYYEREAYTDNRIVALGAFLKLAIWAAWSVLFCFAYYPLILTGRLFSATTGRKKILFASHESQLNGAPRSLLIILENLNLKEFEPFLLSATEGLLTRRARALEVPVIVLPVSQLLTQSPGKHVALQVVRFLISLRYLLAILATLRIQITHTNVLVTPDVAFAATLLSIKRLWHFREAIGDNAWAKVQIWALNFFSDRILCNSNHSRRLLNSRGIFWPKMVTIPNVVGGTESCAENRNRRARESLGAFPGEILIGCVGQITPVKGQETFVRAAVAIANRFKHVKFVVVGTTENQSYVDRLAGIIGDANLVNRIKLCGYRTDILDVMDALDVHVTPSQWAEPFGRVALESMARGAVSVVSKIGGLPEIVIDGTTGLHFIPGNVDDLVSVLTRLIVDPELLKRLREAGTRRAHEHFSVRRQLDDLENIYRYPLPTIERLSQTSLWIALRDALPGRMRSHPKLLIYYPILFIGVALFWLLVLPLFVVTLPFAMTTGWVIRRNATIPRIGVLAYQTSRNAATRFRIMKPFDRLRTKGVKTRIYYPSSKKLGNQVYVSLFYGHLSYVKDFYYYFVVFIHRLYAILRCYSDHCVVIQYELFYEGPMWMELLVARTHPRVIYDYDDSLYAFPRYAKYLPKLLSTVDQVVVGNRYLAEYSKKYNRHVSIIPTCPDHDAFIPRSDRVDELAPNDVRIGWIGNPANLSYLNMVSEVIRRLSSEYVVTLIIVCAGPYDLATLRLEDLPIRRKEWSLETEGEDICTFDIGIMPIWEDVVGEGKCGFKALQYMAAGVPCVASPVGINSEIIEHGVTGYLARSEEEWYQFLKTLVESLQLRQRMGQRGRQFTLSHYSLDIATQKWSDVIRSGFREGFVEGDLRQPT